MVSVSDSGSGSRPAAPGGRGSGDGDAPAARLLARIKELWAARAGGALTAEAFGEALGEAFREADRDLMALRAPGAFEATFEVQKVAVRAVVDSAFLADDPGRATLLAAYDIFAAYWWDAPHALATESLFRGLFGPTDLIRLIRDALWDAGRREEAIRVGAVLLAERLQGPGPAIKRSFIRETWWGDWVRHAEYLRLAGHHEAAKLLVEEARRVAAEAKEFDRIDAVIRAAGLADDRGKADGAPPEKAAAEEARGAKGANLRDLPDLLTYEDVAAVLKCSVKTVQNNRAGWGLVPASRLGGTDHGKPLFRKADVRRLVEKKWADRSRGAGSA